jgi:hypothetical protein
MVSTKEFLLGARPLHYAGIRKFCKEHIPFHYARTSKEDPALFDEQPIDSFLRRGNEAIAAGK